MKSKGMAYFSTLEGLPPVDMDSTGLHHKELLSFPFEIGFLEK